VRIYRVEDERAWHECAHQPVARHAPMAHDPCWQLDHRLVAVGRRRPSRAADSIAHHGRRGAPLLRAGRSLRAVRCDVGIQGYLPSLAERAPHVR
jgi:hypothetical protein